MFKRTILVRLRAKHLAKPSIIAFTSRSMQDGAPKLIQELKDDVLLVFDASLTKKRGVEILCLSHVTSLGLFFS